MDISKLLSAAPGLMEQLSGLGLKDEQVSELGNEVGDQLTGGDGFDLGDLLQGLDVDSFLAKVNVPAIAAKVGVSEEMAQKAIDLIAPHVSAFGGQFAGQAEGIKKGLFGMAKGLFGR